MSKDSRHVDRLINFSVTFDPPIVVVPVDPPLVSQDLLLVPLHFQLPEGGLVENEAVLQDLLLVPLHFQFPEGGLVENEV